MAGRTTPVRGWGTSWKQRVRLAPLYLAVTAADAIRAWRPRRHSARQDWQPGISVVIPERDAPAMLDEALAALYAALHQVPEPHRVIVVANGSRENDYADLRVRWPQVQWTFSAAPLGFARAIAAGLAHAHYDWTLLLNNDMTLAPSALAHLASCRSEDVFAIAAQIFQRSPSGRREETGFTDWYVDGNGVHLYHAPPPSGRAVLPHLCASGGASLFRTAVLRRYVPDSLAYDPFYWEDAEWSVRAWRDGWRVLFDAEAHAEHRHRATTARFHAPDELERIVEQHRLLFDIRQAVTPETRSALMRRVCDLPYRSQRALSRLGVAMGAFRQRIQARSLPPPLPPPCLWRRDVDMASLPATGFAYRLAPRVPARPLLLVVTPFVVFPARHGGARRIAELLRGLLGRYDVVLVSDEAEGHDPRSFAGFDGLLGVYLVQRRSDETGAPTEQPLDARIATHVHDALRTAVRTAIETHRPDVIQVEHAELAPLVHDRRAGETWVLGLHDACTPRDFANADGFARFEQAVAAYDAITVCSPEDAALVRHGRVACVPNGAAVEVGGYVASHGAQLLFVGPFRYAPNATGIRTFLADVYPGLRSEITDLTLLVLGGDEAIATTRNDPLFAQPGVTVLGHCDDVPVRLRACAMTINPLGGIRGSAVKLVESIGFGRVCVSTREGARGFATAGFEGLVMVADVASMGAPLLRLLRDPGERHRRERPDPRLLAPYRWSACADALDNVYRELAQRRAAAHAA
ncbi:MAG: glycosyltransferase [Casimicrobiaceae bacterium]